MKPSVKAKLNRNEVCFTLEEDNTSDAPTYILLEASPEIIHPLVELIAHYIHEVSGIGDSMIYGHAKIIDDPRSRTKEQAQTRLYFQNHDGTEVDFVKVLGALNHMISDIKTCMQENPRLTTVAEVIENFELLTDHRLPYNHNNLPAHSPRTQLLAAFHLQENRPRQDALEEAVSHALQGIHMPTATRLTLSVRLAEALGKSFLNRIEEIHPAHSQHNYIAERIAPILQQYYDVAGINSSESQQLAEINDVAEKIRQYALEISRDDGKAI